LKLPKTGVSASMAVLPAAVILLDVITSLLPDGIDEQS
jgi:hypothetical protein